MGKKLNIDIPYEGIVAFSRKWGVKEISLFGSVLTSEFNPSSDIDVLVTFKRDTHYGLFDLVRMEDELKEIFGREVDLIDRRSVDSSRNYIRKREVLSSLETVYVA